VAASSNSGATVESCCRSTSAAMAPDLCVSCERRSDAAVIVNPSARTTRLATFQDGSGTRSSAHTAAAETTRARPASVLSEADLAPVASLISAGVRASSSVIARRRSAALRSVIIRCPRGDDAVPAARMASTLAARRVRADTDRRRAFFMPPSAPAEIATSGAAAASSSASWSSASLAASPSSSGPVDSASTSAPADSAGAAATALLTGASAAIASACAGVIAAPHITAAHCTSARVTRPTAPPSSRRVPSEFRRRSSVAASSNSGATVESCCRSTSAAMAPDLCVSCERRSDAAVIVNPSARTTRLATFQDGSGTRSSAHTAAAETTRARPASVLSEADLAPVASLISAGVRASSSVIARRRSAALRSVIIRCPRGDDAVPAARMASTLAARRVRADTDRRRAFFMPPSAPAEIATSGAAAASSSASWSSASLAASPSSSSPVDTAPA